MSSQGVGLEKWLESLVGQKLQEKSVIGCCVSLAAKSMEAINLVEHRLDEEGLTASLVGSLASALPLSFLAFGSNTPSQVSEFGWGQYRKHGSDAWSESMRGADFALLVKLPSGRVRLSIFQAKSDWSDSVPDGHIKIRQHRKRKDGAAVKQLEALHNTGCDLMRRTGEKSPGTQHLTWVHYLCQLNGQLCCLPLSRISEQVALELKDEGDPMIKVDGFDAVHFADVLADAFESQSTNWLEINAVDADGKVPECIELTSLAKLMNLIVGEDGSGSWQLVLNGCERSPLVGLSGSVGKFDIRYKLPPPKDELGSAFGL
ncbi:hypothetical protein JH274_12465 [Xanthomonas campestris pv. incanae]|uniref:hypothetical protein n=1 Tax=Xanthomonas campestris TaxID=339 RepID=UPI0023678608|nr:hypothetical protein [Xanthomonas campestris]WDJ86710.1 hypothetical protein JH279_09115 [Xanthomonas campestris pv. incanae]WDK24169.1 hypothetical protein JH274_12465 [Xanthomonas campestris pv. incanae]